MNDKPVQWAGLNHLALITNDMDLTTRFWHGVIGASLVATIGNDAFRHYFFDVGSGATVASGPRASARAPGGGGMKSRCALANPGSKPASRRAAESTWRMSAPWGKADGY